MFNAKPLQIVKAQFAAADSLYVLTATTGQQVALDTSIYATPEQLIEGIKSGEVGSTSANALELLTLIGGPDAITGLKNEIESLGELDTIYEA